MISIETYSPKGLIVKGASAGQAEAIRAALGEAVVTAYNPRFGGWCFSRKREDRIRALVADLNQDDLPGKWGVLAKIEASRAAQH